MARTPAGLARAPMPRRVIAAISVASVCMASVLLAGGCLALQHAPAQAQSQLEATSAFALPGLGDLRQTRERPLFTPSRKPPFVAPPAARPLAPVVAPQPPPQAAPDQIILTGVVFGQGTSVAVLQDAQTGEVHRLRRGESVLGWSVAEIEAKTVRLRKSGNTRTLELFPEVRR